MTSQWNQGRKWAYKKCIRSHTFSWHNFYNEVAFAEKGAEGKREGEREKESSKLLASPPPAKNRPTRLQSTPLPRGGLNPSLQAGGPRPPAGAKGQQQHSSASPLGPCPQSTQVSGPHKEALALA